MRDMSSVDFVLLIVGATIGSMIAGFFIHIIGL